MEKQAVFDKVVTLITPYCKNEEALKNVGDSSRFIDDLGTNSARLVDIVLAFEDEFDIEIDDDTADKIQTVGDAVNLICEKAEA
jgi:acyl carrier protein